MTQKITLKELEEMQARCDRGELYAVKTSFDPPSRRIDDDIIPALIQEVKYWMGQVGLRDLSIEFLKTPDRGQGVLENLKAISSMEEKP